MWKRDYMPCPQKINIQKALRQRSQGMSYGDIAKAQNVSKTQVVNHISPILKELANPATVEYYRKNQAAIMDGLAARTVSSITTEDYEKATLQQKVVAVGILTDKSRLIQGQSTSNQAILLQAVFDSEEGE